eukprot:CAMPEP_0173291292 /NCGR_PEP_ID=MMETSP1143-20121109/12075_1 /TAXON_ID=483371 /ORGANISM="non described non described, Strain CCMP2298" /LENGTH=117 /DNA_ID=CAMNT_0014230519 /DNA_START=3991 /DNA_END=4344 /DNA_ORIENTATION=+
MRLVSLVSARSDSEATLDPHVTSAGPAGVASAAERMTLSPTLYFACAGPMEMPGTAPATIVSNMEVVSALPAALATVTLIEYTWAERVRGLIVRDDIELGVKPHSPPKGSNVLHVQM